MIARQNKTVSQSKIVVSAILITSIGQFAVTDTIAAELKEEGFRSESSMGIVTSGNGFGERNPLLISGSKRDYCLACIPGTGAAPPEMPGTGAAPPKGHPKPKPKPKLFLIPSTTELWTPLKVPELTLEIPKTIEFGVAPNEAKGGIGKP